MKFILSTDAEHCKSCMSWSVQSVISNSLVIIERGKNVQGEEPHAYLEVKSRGGGVSPAVTLNASRLIQLAKDCLEAAYQLDPEVLKPYALVEPGPFIPSVSDDTPSLSELANEVEGLANEVERIKKWSLLIWSTPIYRLACRAERAEGIQGMSETSEENSCKIAWKNPNRGRMLDASSPGAFLESAITNFIDLVEWDLDNNMVPNPDKASIMRSTCKLFKAHLNHYRRVFGDEHQ